MRRQPRQHAVVRPAPPPPPRRPSSKARPSRAREEVVDQRVPRPGVEGDERPRRLGRRRARGSTQVTLPTPPRFRNATGASAPIQPRAGEVEERHQRRPLAAARHVRGAEVPDHRQPAVPRQPVAAPDLMRPPPARLVRQRLPVEADDLDALEPGHRRRVRRRAPAPRPPRAPASPGQRPSAAAQQRPLRRRRRRGTPLGPKPAIVSPSVSSTAASTPSIEVPDISPSARIGSPFRPARIRYRTAPLPRERTAPMTNRPKSDFLDVMVARGYLQDCTDLAGLDARAARRRRPRLRRLRRHRAVAARRPPAQHHDAALAAEDRPQADHADGRRHHQGRRPVVPLRRAPAAHARRRSPPTSPPSAASSPSTSTTATAPTGAIMLDNAEWLDGLNYLELPARHRPALLGQPDALLRERQVAARPRPVAELPRVQLHDPAGLRLPRAPPPRRLPAADGRLRPVGQHRQRHRPDPPRRRRRGLRPDLAAAHHLRRRARWASPPAARSGSTPRCWRPTTSGSSGATPPTPTSAGSSSSTPSCRSTECDRLGALGGAEINAAKITPRERGHDALPRRRGGRRRRGDGAARSSRRAAPATTSPTLTLAPARRVPAGRHLGRAAPGARRPRRLGQGRAAADRRGRRPPRRRAAHRRRRCTSTPSALGRPSPQALRRPQAPRARPRLRRLTARTRPMDDRVRD